jgi:hypothetical protein
MKDPYADLDRDIDIGPEAREAAREWARTVVFVSLAASLGFGMAYLGAGMF